MDLYFGSISIIVKPIEHSSRYNLTINLKGRGEYILISE